MTVLYWCIRATIGVCWCGKHVLVHWDQSEKLFLQKSLKFGPSRITVGQISDFFARIKLMKTGNIINFILAKKSEIWHLWWSCKIWGVLKSYTDFCQTHKFDRNLDPLKFTPLHIKGLSGESLYRCKTEHYRFRYLPQDPPRSQHGHMNDRT